ncbi:MAG: glycosyltransferase family 2 protein, partial [Bacteroidales bacterium]|nr:glycosyltransferase family 2 protein [Bacteroidales bacterium]
MYSYNVDCILVTYHPDILLLNRVLDGILFQIRNCYVINNGVQYFCYSTNNITIVNLGRNYGIAYAQNYGIELAKRHNADFVLLSDQDTIYPEDFISKMLDVYEHTEDKEHIGAITPIFYDKNKDRSSAIMATKFYSIIPESHKIYTVAHTISSGSLIPMENLKIIGFMREELFIDYVDTEWYWRALKYGYKILSIPAVAIKH